MATNSQIIIKTRDGEIIPAIQPDSFQLAVQSMDDLDTQLGDIEARAQTLPSHYTDKPTYDKAGALVGQVKSVKKLGSSNMLPFEELLKKVKNFITQEKKTIDEHGDQIIDRILAPGMVEYDQREKRLAAEDQKRQQLEREAQLKREAEETARKDAAAAKERKAQSIAFINAEYRAKRITSRQREKMLREAGALAEAECAKIAADEDDAKERAKEEAAKLKVKPRTGSVAGVRRHTNYRAKCIDQDMFKAALQMAWEKKDFQTYERLIAVMEVSDQKLSEKAREIMDDEKFMALYPFTLATHEDKV